MSFKSKLQTIRMAFSSFSQKGPIEMRSIGLLLYLNNKLQGPRRRQNQS